MVMVGFSETSVFSNSLDWRDLDTAIYPRDRHLWSQDHKLFPELFNTVTGGIERMGYILYVDLTMISLNAFNYSNNYGFEVNGQNITHPFFMTQPAGAGGNFYYFIQDKIPIFKEPKNLTLSWHGAGGGVLYITIGFIITFIKKASYEKRMRIQ